MQENLRRFKANIFQGLGHPVRVAIIELLRDGEKSAGSLIEFLQVEQANASQHLAVLRTKHIIVSRKEGNQVFYTVRDPIIIELLNIMRQYFETHVAESFAMLEEVKREESLK